MKKLFSIFAAVLFAGSMMAGTVTFTYENSTWTATGEAQSTTIDGVTVASTKGAKNVKNTDFRSYANETFTVSTTAGVILKIEYTLSQGDWTSASVGTYADKVWEGSAASIDFAATAQVRMKSVVVTTGEAPAVFAPAIAGDAQFYDEVEVSLSCATEGAKIYYTLDGTDPTAASAEFTAAFKLTEDKTVKAIAIKGTDKSAVAEKAFKKAPRFATMEALTEATLAEHTLVVVTFEDVKIDSVYVGSKGRNGVYFAVAGTKYEIYYNSETATVPAEWVADGTVSGTIRGDWYSYKGMWELVPTAADWTWAALTYKAPEGTGFENIDANAKAVKFFENGQLVIIKGGVKYNATGAVIK